ncbi:MAG: glycosyltransferase family 39 protein [Oceanospirillaceae bacterium]
MNRAVWNQLKLNNMLGISLSLIIFTLTVRLFSLNLYPVMDTTEARYGEMARIMLETGNWLTPMFDYDVPFWGKPPIFTWLSATGLKFLGDNEFALRAPHFLVALATLFVIWYLAKTGELFNRSSLSTKDNTSDYAWLSCALLATTSIFIIIGAAVMTDTALMFSVSLAMTSFWLYWQKKNMYWGYLFFVALALGMLSKGPIALLLVGISLCIWISFQSRWHKLLHCLPWRSGILVFIVLALPWYLLAERATPGFLNYFLLGEHFKRFVVSGWEGDLYGSAHNRMRGTIWLYWVIATLPWFPLFITQLVRYYKSSNKPLEKTQGIDSFLYCWLLSPLILFSFSGNILWTYVLPGIPAFALLLARFQMRCPLALKYYYLGLFTPLLILLGVAVIALRPMNKPSQKPLIQTWQQQLEYKNSTIYYLKNLPFSARYYTKGKAKLIDDTLANITKNLKGEFIVIRAQDMPTNLVVLGCEKRFSTLKHSLIYCI